MIIDNTGKLYRTLWIYAALWVLLRSAGRGQL